MKRIFIALLLFASPALAQNQECVLGFDCVAMVQLLDEAAATPETAVTVTNLTIEVWQPYGSDQSIDQTIASLITNGSFDANDSTGWTLNVTGSGASIASNQLQFSASTSTNTYAMSAVGGFAYEVTVVSTGASAGSCTLNIGGGTAGAAISTSTTTTQTLVAGASDTNLHVDCTSATINFDDFVDVQGPVTIIPTVKGGGTNDADCVTNVTGYCWVELTAEQLPVVGNYAVIVYDAGEVLAKPTWIKVVDDASFQHVNEGTTATAQDVVDELMAETIAGAVAGTVEEALDSVSTILTDTADMQPKLGSPAGASISADIATVDSNVDAILVDTGTTLDAALAVVDSNVDAILVDTGTTLDAALAVVDSNVDAILVDTGTTLDGAITTIDGIVDAILLDTGTDGVVLTSTGLAASAATEVAAAIGDLVIETNGSITVEQALCGMLAVLAGETTSNGLTFLDPSGNSTRITATVNGSNERTAMVLSLSCQ